MTDTPTSEKRAIVVDYELTAAPERVWRALTEPEVLARWLMPNDIAPIVGHRFSFRTNPVPGFDGVVRCEILEVLPHERLVYTWRGGPLDTVVTWTLTPAARGGTRLHLVHDGFGPDQGLTYDMLADGWRKKATGSLEKAISEPG